MTKETLTRAYEEKYRELEHTLRGGTTSRPSES